MKPKASDLASDLLWQELRKCWMDWWSYDFFRTPEFEELRRWYLHSNEDAPYPRLLLCHQETLKALVNLHQLDTPVAAGIQRAFVEVVYHRLRGMGTCYLGMPPQRPWRANLSQQTQALSEMSRRGSLDAATVKRAGTSIAREIFRLRRSEASPLATETFGAACDEEGAASVLVALLSRPSEP